MINHFQRASRCVTVALMLGAIGSIMLLLPVKFSSDPFTGTAAVICQRMSPPDAESCCLNASGAPVPDSNTLTKSTARTRIHAPSANIGLLKAASLAASHTRDSALPAFHSDLNPHSQTLTHVVLPIIPSQYDKVRARFKLWETFKPCGAAKGDGDAVVRRPKLVFLVAFSDTGAVQQEEADSKDQVLSMFNAIPGDVRGCFGGVEFKPVRLKPADNTHLLGSRLMFEHLLTHPYLGINATTLITAQTPITPSLLPDAQYVFVYEPDTEPIRNRWLEKLTLETNFPQSIFWVKGSIFRGALDLLGPAALTPTTPSDASRLAHFNGAGIFNIGDVEFRKFYFLRVRPYISDPSHNGGATVWAHDCDITEYLFNSKHYDYTRTVIQNFLFSNIIQNIYLEKYSARDVAASNPNTFLVHGGERQA